MKTINFFKTALLTIALFVCGNVWGETATSNFLSSKTTDAQIVENSKPITYKCSSKNDYENPARIYKNSTLTISSTDNSIITKIELSGPNSHPLTNFTCETGDYQAETTNATWTGEATSVIFNASVGQTRVQSIIVTYTPATAASVATPTFSVQTGKYTEAQSVTIDCATAEASIYYTLDETEPSAESTPYSEAINISSTTTLKAVAVKNGESSAVASATYTFPTEVNSIEAFYELSDDTFAKITGNLTIVFVNGSSVYMQDASGSGGFFGKGFLNGTQTKLKYVPEQDTDFIFCTVGEEQGFVGASGVIILFAVFIWRLIHLAERQSTRFGRVYGYSVLSIFFFHLFVNIGMVLGLTPVIGIPLPFFSYGGSSLWGFTILLFVFLRIDASRER